MFGLTTTAPQEKADIGLLKRQLEAVQAVSHALKNVVDLDKTLDTVVYELGKKLNYLNPVIYLINTDDNETFSVKKVDVPELIVKLTNKFVGQSVYQVKFKLSDDNLLAKAIKSNTQLTSKDFAEVFSPYLKKTAARTVQVALGIGHTVVTPLVLEDKVIGCLTVASRTPEPTYMELDVLSTFADQITIAISNAQSFQEKQDQLTAIQQQNRDLQSLFNLTSRISQSLNPQEVAQTAVDSLPQDDMMLGGAVSTYNPKTKLLTVAAAANSPVYQKVLELIGGDIHIDVPVYSDAYRGGLVRKVMDTKRPQFADDMETFFTPGLPKAVVPILVKLLQIESVAVFPLLANGEITGIVSYFLKTKSKQGAEERRMQLLQTYTLQIASALENSNLFQDLQKAIEQLKEAHRRERDMMDVMGHELRTPIAIVRNAIMMLDRSYVKHAGTVAPAEMRKYLDMAIESVRREISLIETLLSATKIDASRMQLALTKVDFKDVVNDAIEGQRGLVTQKNLNVEALLPENDVFVYADRVSAQEIMDNFYSNAVKYTDVGSVKLTMWTDPETKLAWVQIKDSGIGIAEEDLSHLGKKFFRANQYIPTQDPNVNKFIRPGGTGLGLYVAFNLVGVMGGKLFINSQVGKGSTFTFSIPIYTDQADTAIGAIFPNGNTNRDHVILNGDAPVPPA